MTEHPGRDLRSGVLAFTGTIGATDQRAITPFRS
jgi:hypothetical protein